MSYSCASKAWHARWFGKNGQLLVSCQNKEELTLIDNRLYVFSIEFGRGNLIIARLKTPYPFF
jgi:hypothetical protein